MKVLVTGGTGTVGRILVRRLLADDNVKLIRVLGRSEYRTLLFKQEFAREKKLDVLTGDVSDARSLELNCRDVNLVYHLAAMKHVDLVERDPYLAMRTNIEGTQNVVEAALRVGVERAVIMSTDKVVHASSLYGATKLVAEKIALSANRVKPIFNVFRSGNVLNSSGSVLEVWRREVKVRNAISVTDPAMTRFYLEKGTLASYLLGMPRERPGVVLVPKSKSIRLIDLARIFVKLYGDGQTRIEVVGKRPGEKQDEELVSSEELDRTREEADRYLILPERVERPLDRVPSSADFVMEESEALDLVRRELAGDGDL